MNSGKLIDRITTVLCIGLAAGFLWGAALSFSGCKVDDYDRLSEDYLNDYIMNKDPVKAEEYKDLSEQYRTKADWWADKAKKLFPFD